MKSKCDFRLDCCDSSDERRATCDDFDRCNFEGGDLCGWQQLDDDQMDFTIKAGMLSGKKVQRNPAIMEVKGQMNFMCYGRIFAVANIKN